MDTSQSGIAAHSSDAAIIDAEEELSRTSHAPPMWYQNPAQVTAMLSNFSTSYNVVNISIVLPILQDLHHGSSEDAAACASSLLAGMIIGQIFGGALGDSSMGRLGAIRFVMVVQIAASIGSASLWGDDIYVWLACWRFLLGIGAGAVYPLAAILSAEEASGKQADRGYELSPEGKIQQINSVVLTFSMQGFGFLSVPLVAVPLLYLTPESSLDVVWRLLLGFGCIPGILLATLHFCTHRSSDLEPIPQVDSMSNESVEEWREEPLLVNEGGDHIEQPDDLTEVRNRQASAIRLEPNLLQKLLGTAGTWFLFDVLFYGNTIFQPIVLETAFGGGDPDEDDVIKKAAVNSLILALIALPGYAISALVMGKRVCHIVQTPRYVQMQGFALMGILYCIIGVYWTELKRVPWLLVLLYGATFFFANFGPNTTTFIFPSLIYSHDCRSTLNGISAAAGKGGAVLGATLFAPTAASLGDDKVMLLCAAVSILALVLTKFFTRIPDLDQS